MKYNGFTEDLVTVAVEHIRVELNEVITSALFGTHLSFHQSGICQPTP